MMRSFLKSCSRLLALTTSMLPGPMIYRFLWERFRRTRARRGAVGDSVPPARDDGSRCMRLGRGLSDTIHHQLWSS
ncbi:hypothetical protein Naga_101241g1 [Nannochloropsis gaditana]|uniref:Uncharacterized protein n=1 Tax=Nannochloropsis gaditana TaxID=72520 RepID=W7TBY5_9STRA|nr:hypothetical protein Naga_101241g1 [Nannochloropsis gaditana]